MAVLPHLRRSAATLLCLLTSSAPFAIRAQTQQPTPTQIDLAQFAGQYRGTSNPDTLMSIYREDGRLYEEREGRPRRELLATPTPDRFDIPNLTSHLLFTRDASGQVTACRILSNADNHVLQLETRISTAETRISHYRPYTRTESMIPMRDGVHLHTVILSPTQPSSIPAEPLPFLIQRTPYGTDDATSEDINLSKPELAASGYLFVFQDIRGRYTSEGKFIMNRPIVPHTSPTSIDETTDIYDTVAWLLKNIPNNNGRAGVLGVSYDGFLAIMAGISPHAAIKAISPQAPMTDVWLGDDFFHNGAFRQSYGFDYVQQMEAQKTDAVVNMHFGTTQQDAFDYFLQHTNFAEAAAAAKISDLPTARAFLTQPTYTRFWQDMAVQTHLAQVTVPTLEVGGFWDQEDMYGTQAEYAAMATHNPNLFLVLGPWNHGQWEDTARKLGTNLGSLDFNEPTGTEYRKLFEAPFFEKYLKDKPGFDLTNTATYRTGTNHWQRYNTWPPTLAAGFTPTSLYLQPNHTLSLTAPSPHANQLAEKPASEIGRDFSPGKSHAKSTRALAPGICLSESGSKTACPAEAPESIAATYISDPANPVPYRHRPIQSTYAPGSKWYTWLVEDQRFVTTRPDLATFTLPTLDHDLTFTGEVTADLFASTTGTDADWIVKLIDVYPDTQPCHPERSTAKSKDLRLPSAQPPTPPASPRTLDTAPTPAPCVDPDPASQPPASTPGYQLMVASEIFRGRYRTSFEHPTPLTPNAPTEFRYSLHAIDHTFLKGHSIMVEVQSTWFPLYDRNPQTFVPNIMSAPAAAYQPQTITIYSDPQHPSHLELQTAP